MKKLSVVILFSCLSFIVSAGFELSVNEDLYSPEASINLSSGQYDCALFSDMGVDFSTYYLILYPKTAAYFVQDIFVIFPLDPSPWEDMDILYIEPSPIPNPTNYIGFTIQFNGPAADFAVVDPAFNLLNTWHLVPEPASLLLLGLGGLTLRIRKK